MGDRWMPEGRTMSELRHCRVTGPCAGLIAYALLAGAHACASALLKRRCFERLEYSGWSCTWRPLAFARCDQARHGGDRWLWAIVNSKLFPRSIIIP